MATTEYSDPAPNRERGSNIPWERIISRIENQMLTPFLGAGISHPPLPTATELAEQLATEYHYPFLSRDLAQVAQYVATNEEEAVVPKEFVQRVLEAIEPPNFDDPLQPHALLASLPIPVYLTTNYDKYMELALSRNRTPRSELCRWHSGLRHLPDGMSGETEPEVGRPVVYHIHGVIDKPDSYVLTEDDYLDFMVNSRRYEGTTDTSLRVIPPKIDELISQNSLLFLGYGLRDVNLRVLLRTLVQGADRAAQRVSVSVQLEPDDKMVAAVGRPAAIAYLEKYFQGLKIRVYWGKVDDFLAELKQRWDASRLVAARGGTP